MDVLPPSVSLLSNRFVPHDVAFSTSSPLTTTLPEVVLLAYAQRTHLDPLSRSQILLMIIVVILIEGLSLTILQRIATYRSSSPNWCPSPQLSLQRGPVASVSAIAMDLGKLRPWEWREDAADFSYRANDKRYLVGTEV